LELAELLIVYDSKTKNVERFVQKLDMPNTKIHRDLVVSEKFVLITYTTGFGAVPKSTIDFLRNNPKHAENIVGVCASGNKNWGMRFAFSADRISEEFEVNILHKFEMSGLDSDVEKVKSEVKRIWQNITN